MRRVFLLLIVFIMVTGYSRSASGITLGMYPFDEQTRILVDRLTTDLCSNVYSCFHSSTNGKIVPVSGNISDLYISLLGKNVGISGSTFNPGNLKAGFAQTAGESDHSVRADTAVWSDSAQSIDPSAAVYTAKTIVVTEVEVAEITPKTYFVEYAEGANWARWATKYADRIYTLRTDGIRHHGGFVGMAGAAPNVSRVESTSTPVYYVPQMPETIPLLINDSISQY